MKNKFFILSISCTALSLLSGCGSGISGGPPVNVNFISQGTVASFIKQTGFETNFVPFSTTHFIPSVERTAGYGENSTAQLKSLKYYFTQIQICEGLTTTGTAYSNPSNCIDLYKVDGSAYTTYLNKNALADTDPNHYFDLMDMATTKAKLNKGLPGTAGTYNYGVVTWMRPIKVTAEVTLSDSSTLVTSPTTETAGSADQNGFAQYSSTATSGTLVGTAGSATEGIVTLNNGGNWFKFQNPMTLTGNDPITLDLVFNPEYLIKGSNTGASNYSLQDGSMRGLNIPMIELLPVVHDSSTNAMKESYTITGAGTKANLRLELYYVKSDSAKTIYGVDFKTTYTGTTASNVMHPNKVSFIKTNADGSIDFQDYAKAAMLSGFVRKTNVNETGTVTMNCSNSNLGSSGICPATTDISGATYTLTKVVAVQ